MNILTLNAGSSTLKYKLFGMPGEDVLAKGGLDHAGDSFAEGVSASERSSLGVAGRSARRGSGITRAAQAAIEHCRPLGIDAFGHRVVHGGQLFAEPTRVSPEILASLRTLVDLDPLHNPTETAMIETGMRVLADVPAVAVFDTAFHQTLPEIATRYALPRDLSDRLGLRRYGFHGISYQYVSGRLLELMQRSPDGTRLIVCHLGSGASVCALRDGRSVDTSMGMTPLEGLVMGTRSGDVDAGLLLHLLRCAGMTVEAVDDLLSHQSGLLGVSGRSGDVRELEEAAAAGDEHAALALELFAYRVAKYIGAYAAVLEGVDAVAFTGGIGEHSADVRSRICRRLAFLGLRLDPARNADATGSATRIDAAGATVQAWVIETDEELQIAREVHALLARP